MNPRTTMSDEVDAVATLLGMKRGGTQGSKRTNLSSECTDPFDADEGLKHSRPTVKRSRAHKKPRADICVEPPVVSRSKPPIVDQYVVPTLFFVVSTRFVISELIFFIVLCTRILPSVLISVTDVVVPNDRVQRVEKIQLGISQDDHSVCTESVIAPDLQEELRSPVSVLPTLDLTKLRTKKPDVILAPDLSGANQQVKLEDHALLAFLLNRQQQEDHCPQQQQHVAVQHCGTPANAQFVLASLMHAQLLSSQQQQQQQLSAQEVATAVLSAEIHCMQAQLQQAQVGNYMTSLRHFSPTPQQQKLQRLPQNGSDLATALLASLLQQNCSRGFP